MCEGLHWIEYVRAFGPVLIAVFVAYVAYQQWNVNRGSLREKLFDKRFDLFKDVQRFLSRILETALYPDDLQPSFFDAIQRSRFLFGKEIHEYLMTVHRRALRARLLSNKLKNLSVGEERSKLVEEEHIELNWLNDQLNEIFTLFEPYLGFEKHK